MRIAIFHNFLDNIGGAEIVSLTLSKELNADVYTTNIDKEKIIKMGFSDVLPRIFSIGRIPINAPFRQQMALFMFRFLNLKDKYDYYIICGDWAMSGAVKNKPNLWYVHSPIREIWDSYEYIRDNTLKIWQRPLFYLWAKYNRYLNKKYIQSVQDIACNSENTKKRVKKYLNRDADVIYPPIDILAYNYRENNNYWLSVNRLFLNKRIDIQLKAFRELPEEKLIIVGSYEKSKHFMEYANYVKRNKPDNVEIISWVDKNKLLELYSGCKGFISTSKDEDFGMSVVEAMASGKPVIAPNEGGYKESLINNITGKLINDINENKLIEAIKEISGHCAEYRNNCLLRAKEFDKSIFINKIKKIIHIKAIEK